MKRKIAMVVQRYGKEVNGGAETLARQLAENMKGLYDIEVLTTKAIDYVTWKDEYADATEVIDGITVRRFSVDKPRNIEEFGAFCPKVLGNDSHSLEDEQKWFELQGPSVPELFEYIADNVDTYDVFIFMTYLYSTTVKGLPLVKDKSILISTAHDETPIYLKTFEQLFKMPKAMYYLTVEERDFVRKKFGIADIRDNDGHGGSGIEVPSVTELMPLAKRGILEYIVYVGRIDSAKGCEELFDNFVRYKERNPNKLKLVLMGKAVLDIPDNEDIVSLGFVSEEEKYNVMAGAKMLVMPSHFESLSIVVLESMALGVPVVVNSQCDVLKGHCVRSNAGLYYTNYSEFEACVNYLIKNGEESSLMGQNGIEYVKDNYTWDKIVGSMVDLIEYVVNEKA